jgi:hypothetical protein
LWEAAIAEVTKMLRNNWLKVERVAALLLRQGEVQPCDIDTAMAEPQVVREFHP